MPQKNDFPTEISLSVRTSLTTRSFPHGNQYIFDCRFEILEPKDPQPNFKEAVKKMEFYNSRMGTSTETEVLDRNIKEAVSRFCNEYGYKQKDGQSGIFELKKKE